MKGILYYDTKYGATKQISEWIKKKARLAESVKIDGSLTIDKAADFYVLGAPVFIGKPMESMVDFILRNKSYLINKPVFIFIVSWAQSTKYRNECGKFIDLLVSYLSPGTPVICKSLPGRLYMDNISKRDRSIMERLLKRIDGMSPAFNSKAIEFNDQVSKKQSEEFGGEIYEWTKGCKVKYKGSML